MLSYFRLQYRFLSVRNHNGSNFPATLQHPHNGGLILPTCACDAALAFADVHVPRFSADKSFVRFHFAREQSESAICQSKAQAVSHKPCSLLSHSKIAG